MLLNTLEYADNLLKQSNDSNDIDRIKSVYKLLSKNKDDNNYYINYDDLKNKLILIILENQIMIINIKTSINLIMMMI